MNVDEILEFIERKLEKYKSYLKVLDEFESRTKTTNRYYYLGRIHQLEEIKEFILLHKK